MFKSFNLAKIANCGQNSAKFWPNGLLLSSLSAQKCQLFIPVVYIMLCEQKFGICRLGFTFLVFETPLPFSIFKQLTLLFNLFFQNDQLLNLTAAGVLRKKIVIPYLTLKLSLTLPHKGKMNFCYTKCHFLTILWKKT